MTHCYVQLQKALTRGKHVTLHLLKQGHYSLQLLSALKALALHKQQYFMHEDCLKSKTEEHWWNHIPLKCAILSVHFRGNIPLYHLQDVSWAHEVAGAGIAGGWIVLPRLYMHPTAPFPQHSPPSPSFSFSFPLLLVLLPHTMILAPLVLPGQC